MSIAYPSLNGFSEGLADLTAQVHASVVQVHAGGRGIGSGIIWRVEAPDASGDSDATIVTNAHVVRATSAKALTLQLADQRKLQGLALHNSESRLRVRRHPCDADLGWIDLHYLVPEALEEPSQAEPGQSPVFDLVIEGAEFAVIFDCAIDPGLDTDANARDFLKFEDLPQNRASAVVEAERSRAFQECLASPL